MGYNTCKVKNTGSSPETYCGLTMQVDDEYTIPDRERIIWGTDSNVIDAVNAGDLIVNDGNDDLPAIDALSYMLHMENDRLQVEKIKQDAVVVVREGQREIVFGEIVLDGEICLNGEIIIL